MSNQIVISSGAKVRSLEGVLTGTAGIVNSVPLGGANGVATLDSNGKVPLSQLPASVVTYLGTWNAATNTPTLANGTGDVGDLYICNAAGTVNFGAGPITFAVGDWVIYNGSEWQKSAGQNGTVTSVAVTSTGNDAISITGSPITTAGTINIGFTGDNTQYINGAGDLTTFPSLTGYVPYTGATTDVDLGAHVLNAQALHVKGTAGAGHLGLKHQSAAATGSANESLIYANVDGDLAWQNDNLYLTTLSTHANTANRVYTFPNASGTIALTSDISYPVTSVFGRTGAVTAQSGDYTTTLVTEGTNLYYTDARARGAISLTTTGTSGAATYNSTTGVLNIPQYAPDLSGYVTLSTTQTISGAKTFSAGVTISNTGNQPLKLADYATSITTTTGYTTIGTNANGFQIVNGGGKGANFFFGSSTYAYYLPSSNGTIALTSDIPSLSGYVPYTGATSAVDLGNNNFSSYNVNVNGDNSTYGGILNFRQANTVSGSGSLGYTSINALGKTSLWFYYNISSGVSKAFNLSSYNLTNNVPRTYTMPDADGTIALTSDIPSLANYVTLTGTQTITGVKTFSNEQLFSNGLTINNGFLTFADSGFSSTLDTTTLTASRAILLPNASGTLALTSQLTSGTVTSVGLSSATSGVTIGSSPITTSGTITLAIATASGSQQGLLSSTDWTTFNNKQNALTNPVTGTGTTNYVLKFTGASTIGNSIISENSNEISINVAYPTLIFNGSRDYALQSNDASGAFRILDNTAGLERFSIASTGAATFSSSVTATSANGSPATSGTTQTASLRLAYTNGVGLDFGAYSGSPYGTWIQAVDRGALGSTYPLILQPIGGNVGIGTSSPSYKLDVSAVGYGFQHYADASNYLRTYCGSTYQIIESNGTNQFGYVGGNFFVQTGGTERMRITSGGYIGIGTTNPLDKFVVDGGNNIWTGVFRGTTTTSQSFGVQIFAGTNSSDTALRILNGATTTSLFMVRGDGNTRMNDAVFSNTTSGSTRTVYIGNGDYYLGGISSIRASKKNIENISNVDWVYQLNPVTFNYRKKDKEGSYTEEIYDDLNYGLIAEDTAPIADFLINYNDKEDGTKEMVGIEYPRLIIPLLKAIQELKAEIDQLKAK